MKKCLTLILCAVFSINLAISQNLTPNHFTSVNGGSTKALDNVVGTVDKNPAPAFNQGNAKSEISIGTGTGLERYPIYAYFGYSYTQSIYLQSEIGQSGSITKISYYFNGATLANSNDWTIYIGHTTKTAFASTTDWEPLANLTQVYSGVFTSPTGPGWIDFILTNPFNYNNTDNLVIAVDENAANYDNATDKFYSSTVTDLRSLCDYSDTENFDPAAPGTAGYHQALIPNVKITIGTPLTDDIGVISVDLNGAYTPGTVSPKATIKNFGTVAQSGFNVEMTINSTPAYSQTYNVAASLAPGATTQITFPNWTAAVGSYSVKVKNLFVDLNLGNDSLLKNVNVFASLTNAYCLKGGYQPAKFFLESPESGFTNLGTPLVPFGRGGAYVATATSEKWFVLDSDYNLQTIDTLTGVATLVGATGGIAGEFVNGLAYDKSTNTLYASKLSGTYPAFAFNLYTIDQTTGVMTLVATSPSTGTFLEIACNNAGDMFAIEHQQAGVGRFYSVDKTTAALTLIGTDMGGNVSSNFQDIDFSANDILYFTASMGTDGTLDGLYTINTSTGLPTLINLFPAANTQLVGLGIKKSYSYVSINENNNENNFTLFPNPTKDLVSVISKNNEIIKTVKVLSLTGQLIYSENVNHIATTLNTANFSAGIYFVEVKTNNGVYTQKIAVTK